MDHRWRPSTGSCLEDFKTNEFVPKIQKWQFYSWSFPQDKCFLILILSKRSKIDQKNSNYSETCVLGIFQCIHSEESIWPNVDTTATSKSPRSFQKPPARCSAEANTEHAQPGSTSLGLFAQRARKDLKRVLRTGLKINWGQQLHYIWRSYQRGEFEQIRKKMSRNL